MRQWPHGGRKSNTSKDENGGIFQDRDVACSFFDHTMLMLDWDIEKVKF